MYALDTLCFLPKKLASRAVRQSYIELEYRQVVIVLIQLHRYLLFGDVHILADHFNYLLLHLRKVIRCPALAA